MEEAKEGARTRGDDEFVREYEEKYVLVAHTLVRIQDDDDDDNTLVDDAAEAIDGRLVAALLPSGRTRAFTLLLLTFIMMR